MSSTMTKRLSTLIKEDGWQETYWADITLIYLKIHSLELSFEVIDSDKNRISRMIVKKGERTNSLEP